MVKLFYWNYLLSGYISRIYKIINAKYANDRNKVFKMAFVRTNRLKSNRFTAILEFNEGISTIQGICFTFKTYNDRTNENKVQIFVFTVHKTLIMSTYQKCFASRDMFCVRPEIAAFFQQNDISNVQC